MESEAEVILSDSTPELTDGKLMAAIRPISATTVIISMSVTPEDRSLWSRLGCKRFTGSSN
jgi:hypothetical protein